ncbi:MAG: recombinase family protein [Candidatus Uhrbacteria bacterium]
MPSMENSTVIVPIVPPRYCLYARKSSEDDERQALSIDSQIKEMLEQAERDGLNIAEVRKESHSAKNSGSRPEFNRLIDDIRQKKFDGILTWAADRISRNAGDLGTVVDLMDQGLLQEIRTSGPRFTNSPSDKFMLMMLCSQAKLENDNKGVNVKRGFRAKVEMGYRPNMSPLGYLHDKYAEKGARRIYVDPERGPIIKEVFQKVAYEGWTGRDIKNWLDDTKNFTTRKGKKVTLSMIYRMMDNSFYTGRYEFPKGSGKWFDGKHEPLITREVFDRVQDVMKCPTRSLPGTHEFAFTRMFKCGVCGSGITADKKVKRLKDGTTKRYVYYGCMKRWMTGCKQPYIREEDLLDQLYKIIDKVDIDELAAVERIKQEIERLTKMIASLGGHVATAKVAEIMPDIDVYACAKYILKDGTKEEKRDLLSHLRTKMTLRDGKIEIE